MNASASWRHNLYKVSTCGQAAQLELEFLAGLGLHAALIHDAGTAQADEIELVLPHHLIGYANGQLIAHWVRVEVGCGF